MRLSTPALNENDFRIIASKWYQGKELMCFVLSINRVLGYTVSCGVVSVPGSPQEEAIIVLHGAVIEYEPAFGMFGDEMIADIYTESAGRPIRIKYNKELYKPLYKITQTL